MKRQLLTEASKLIDEAKRHCKSRDQFKTLEGLVVLLREIIKEDYEATANDYQPQ